jgi:hypothetical protein
MGRATEEIGVRRRACKIWRIVGGGRDRANSDLAHFNPLPVALD